MHSAESMTLQPANVAKQSIGGPSGYDGKIAGLYDLEETLGSGHFAVVKLARHVFTGAKVAVKVVDKTKLDDVSKAHLFQEVRCMKLVQHPNVVRLYEVIDTQTKLYLVLELGDGGDLYDYIMKHEKGLSEDLARKYFRQILRAITYCHQLHVVHRDLKPENVVFFEKLGVVKLTDFGFSNKFSPGQKLDTFCGSLAYSAPEILLGDSYDAPAVDIWSLGVILYMLVCGQPPFEKANDSETLTMIMDCKYTVPLHLSSACQKLIANMLVRDPQKRASLEQIAADPWLKEHSECDIQDFLPLVSRQELTEDDHTFIIQKMINGNIASKEEILQSLDQNKYNHITATYFLLAEMRLRKHFEEQRLKEKHQHLLPTNSASSIEQISKIKGSNDANKLAAPLNSKMNEVPTDKRNRKCSIVREEEEEEPSYEPFGEKNTIKGAATRRESISDGRLNKSVSQECSNTTTPVVLNTHKKVVVRVDSKLAQKLNKIDQHQASNTNTNIIGAKQTLLATTTSSSTKAIPLQDTIQGLKELQIGKLNALSPSSKNSVLTQKRTKLSKIRTPSCSSSEASDDDTKSRSKKKINKFVGDTPTRFRMHRRDSHDDSSDSQDQAFSSSCSHSHGTNLITSNTANAEEKKCDQNKEQNKSEENRKSHNSHKYKKQSREVVEKSHTEKSTSNMRRRRIRESQSLDRITESQEYELRHRCSTICVDSHMEHRNSLLNLNAFTVAEIKEEYDAESETIQTDYSQMKNNRNIEGSATQSKRSGDIYNLSSIEEINLLLEEKSLMKSIQVTSTKCMVTMRKIRRLGKYFPVVNFS